VSINPIFHGIQGAPAAIDLKAARQKARDLDRDIGNLTTEEAQLGRQLSTLNTDTEQLKNAMFSGNMKRDDIKKNMWLVGLAGLMTYVGASLSSTPLVSIPLGILGAVELGAEAFLAKKLINTRSEIKQAVRDLNDRNGQFESLYFDHKMVESDLILKTRERESLRPLEKQLMTEELQSMADLAAGQPSQAIEEDREAVSIDGVRLEKKKLGSLSSLKKLLHLNR